jgi:hypothetical protein
MVRYRKSRRGTEQRADHVLRRVSRGAGENLGRWRVRETCMVLLACCGIGCAKRETAGPRVPNPPQQNAAAVDDLTATTLLNRVAESYVFLVLSLGRHDPDYVDAYYGPEEWRSEAERQDLPVERIRVQAEGLVRDLLREPPRTSSENLWLRHQYLTKQLQALVTRANYLTGTRLSFDQESRALYDAVAPTNPESMFRDILTELGQLLPGEGSVHDRYERYRMDFVIPEDRLDAVFSAAIDACRERTLQHIALPVGESFQVEYVKNKSWSGYNWYQGGYKSLIQVNVDLPIYIDRALDLACHEGYPGHHVYNTLLEQHLTRERGWVEFSIYPLFSPQSLIAEGSANYGISVAFPGEERVRFERDVLFPAAGLDPARAAEYNRVRELVERLSYAGNEAARRYLDGAMTREQAAEWLTQFALMAPERAVQRTRFIDQYRSYVINYNLGQDLVRHYVEDALPPNASADARWKRFAQLLESPRLPSTLK